jgi:hypothetical protein
LRDSGDTSVRLKQTIRETQEGVHAFAALVVRMARNLHDGFHDILEPLGELIKRHADETKRGASTAQRGK